MTPAKTININRIEKLKTWLMGEYGTHSRRGAWKVLGIWVDPDTGYVSVREDFLDELMADEERLYSLLLESRKFGGRW